MEITQNILTGKKNIHMIGIGGISMSGLAEILANLGFKVTGSDEHKSDITVKLEESGFRITYGHYPQNVEGSELVVYTAAVKQNNPEIIAAQSLGIPCIDRAELLGLIMKQYEYNIAISGTHGKTTTTSMTSMIMIEAGVDPTIHVGGVLDAIGGNTRIGHGPYFITEACEYVESFLKFYPTLAVILNIDEDHLDYFKDINHIKSSFRKFTELVPRTGYVIACGDDENTVSILNDLECNIYSFGIKSPDVCWKAENIVFSETGCASFDIYQKDTFIIHVSLKVPGLHNVYNALAASLSCYVLGVSAEAVGDGLSGFTGTHRRFECKGIADNITVVDDYAHHPSEIKATLKAAGNTAHTRTWCVFQPHTYTRTKALLNEFATAFEEADAVIVCDIYAARESDTGEIHSSTLADYINKHSKNAIYIPDFEAITSYLLEHASPGDLIITMGAGNVYQVGEMFLNNKKMAAVS